MVVVVSKRQDGTSHPSFAGPYPKAEQSYNYIEAPELTLMRQV